MELYTLMGEFFEYSKDCRDYQYLGVECCPTCHSDPEYKLEVVQVDGEQALLCCQLIAYFYPEGVDSRLSPEERLLRAIFGAVHHVESD